MKELVLLPSLRAQRGKSCGLVLTKKFLEGAAVLAAHWPGPVTALVNVTDAPSTEFDLVPADPEAHGISLEERPTELERLMARLSGAGAVLGFGSRDQMAYAKPCQAADVPLVYITEYSPETERQIVRSENANTLFTARRLVWLWQTERLRQKALKRAAGMQCSGTPTYDLYSPIQPNSLLFFDNRLKSDEIVSEQFCREKAARMVEDRPLRLVFGGRFIPMKGVLELPEMAAALHRGGTRFSLDIYGDGPLKGTLEARVRNLGLEDHVRICAPQDFRTGWVKVLRDETDLFVCSHIQGDPSSTYPEVLSCGVPMVGYDNVAFQGVMRHSGTGWSAPIGHPDLLAREIARLDKDRKLLADAVLPGRNFGAEHAFDRTFKRRAEHLVATAGL